MSDDDRYLTLTHCVQLREDLRHWKFNDENISLDVMKKIDNVLNAITNLYPYLT